MRLMNKAAMRLVAFLSFFFRSLQLRACRFSPSCSNYSIEAFRRFGFLHACGLSVSRVLRCHPFCAGGHDPLPGGSGN